MQDSNDNELGLYVHVPFCSTTCDFCAFYQERPSKKGFEEYFLALEKDFQAHLPDRAFSTVFIGGGTPGILSDGQIDQLCALIHANGLKDECEWTVEVAPNEINPQKLEAFLRGGVNRLSLGVQTLDPVFMKELGRKHDVERAVKAYGEVRAAGFENVNLDLLFGAPGQTLENWKDDLRKVVDLGPDHVSTYCLTFEEDTALFAKLAKGQIKIDPEREAMFYEWAWEYLPNQGYSQYEVSNYARDGYECRHNLNTWGMNEWIGFGPSASSQYNQVRRKNFSNIEQWAKPLLLEESLEYEEYIELDNYDLARDAILFGLRMNRGINLNVISDKFRIPPDSFEGIHKFLELLEKECLAVFEDHQYFLTLEGRMRCDAIALEIPDLSSDSS
jgi:oxygen-independent coproporphyrinogen-3 oxidase